MTVINGLLIVFLFAGGGLFLESSIRRRDRFTTALSAAVLTLGLVEICELILRVEFSEFAIKSWYYLMKILFWGLIGTAFLHKLSLSVQRKRQISSMTLLGILITLGLLLITQTTSAVDWFAPNLSPFTQYVDLLARNRPIRWLTDIYSLFGLGLVLGSTGYVFYKRMLHRSAFLVISLSSLLLFGQEYLYLRSDNFLADGAHFLGEASLLLTCWFYLSKSVPVLEPRMKVSALLSWGIVATIVILGALFRLRSYGDACQAVLTGDTGQFISLSRQEIFSLEFFTANRPAFIMMVYKLANVNPDMQITVVNNPGEMILQPQVYDDLNCLPGWQMAIAILSWSILAIVLASKIRSYWLRTVIPALILGFAYLPPLADWDRIIQSESLSFSMWALTFALSIEFFVVHLFKKKGWLRWLIFGLWGVVLIAWGFSRDTNVFMILWFVVCSILVLLIPIVRKRVSVPFLLSVAVFSLIVFGVQNSLFYHSDRWINSFFNNLNRHILPYPEREAWFIERGLPTPEPLYQYANLLGDYYSYDRAEIAELLTWTDENGSWLYSLYLITHPGWAFSHAWNLSDLVFTENLQPYFKPDLDDISPFPYVVGEILHPKTWAVIWVQMALLAGLIWQVIRPSSEPSQRKIVVVAVVFFLGSLSLLFISIHGDALGLIRHALVAVMPLRLNLWLFAIWLLDGVLPTKKPKQDRRKGDENANTLGAAFR